MVTLVPDLLFSLSTSILQISVYIPSRDSGRVETTYGNTWMLPLDEAAAIAPLLRQKTPVFTCPPEHHRAPDTNYAADVTNRISLCVLYSYMSTQHKADILYKLGVISMSVAISDRYQFE